MRRRGRKNNYSNINSYRNNNYNINYNQIIYRNNFNDEYSFNNWKIIKTNKDNNRPQENDKYRHKFEDSIAIKSLYHLQIHSINDRNVYTKEYRKLFGLKLVIIEGQNYSKIAEYLDSGKFIVIPYSNKYYELKYHIYHKLFITADSDYFDIEKDPQCFYMNNFCSENHISSGTAAHDEFVGCVNFKDRYQSGTKIFIYRSSCEIDGLFYVEKKIDLSEFKLKKIFSNFNEQYINEDSLLVYEIKSGDQEDKLLAQMKRRGNFIYRYLNSIYSKKVYYLGFYRKNYENNNENNLSENNGNSEENKEKVQNGTKNIIPMNGKEKGAKGEEQNKKQEKDEKDEQNLNEKKEEEKKDEKRDEIKEEEKKEEFEEIKEEEKKDEKRDEIKKDKNEGDCNEKDKENGELNKEQNKIRKEKNGFNKKNIFRSENNSECELNTSYTSFQNNNNNIKYNSFFSFPYKALIFEINSTAFGEDLKYEKEEYNLLYNMKNDIKDLKTDVSGLKNGVNNINTDVSGLKNVVNNINTDVSGLKSGMNEMNTKFDNKFNNLDEALKKIMKKFQIE